MACSQEMVLIGHNFINCDLLYQHVTFDYTIPKDLSKDQVLFLLNHAFHLFLLCANNITLI